MPFFIGVNWMLQPQEIKKELFNYVVFGYKDLECLLDIVRKMPELLGRKNVSRSVFPQGI
jgi:hypothetical protein